MSHTVDLLDDLLRTGKITEAEAAEARERRKTRPPPMAIPVDADLLRRASLMTVDRSSVKSKPGR